MFEFLGEYQSLFFWIGGWSLFIAVAGLAALPWVLVKIPADYFRDSHRPVDGGSHSHPALRITVLVLKNVFGLLLVVAGIPMLILPVGQGLLTIVAGLMFMNFPGKRGLERWIVSRPPVFRGINWIRAKAGYPPLDEPELYTLRGEQ